MRRYECEHELPDEATKCPTCSASDYLFDGFHPAWYPTWAWVERNGSQGRRFFT